MYAKKKCEKRKKQFIPFAIKVFYIKNRRDL